MWCEEEKMGRTGGSDQNMEREGEREKRGGEGRMREGVA